VTLVLVILIAHFVGDFLLQSAWMALNKPKRWDALALHVAAYTVVLTFVPLASVIAWLGQPSLAVPVHATLGQFGWFVLVNAVAHFAQDAITSRITARLWFVEGVRISRKTEVNLFAPEGYEYEVAYNNKRHWFFVAIGADQLLHYVTLFVTASWWLA